MVVSSSGIFLAVRWPVEFKLPVDRFEIQQERGGIFLRSPKNNWPEKKLRFLRPHQRPMTGSDLAKENILKLNLGNEASRFRYLHPHDARKCSRIESNVRLRRNDALFFSCDTIRAMVVSWLLNLSIWRKSSVCSMNFEIWSEWQISVLRKPMKPQRSKPS